jgi:predicted DNA-binding transcriptional regulator YafY
MLRLLSLLQTARFWPGAELAERLEVSERTLRRDVDRLRELGYPVRADRGVGGGYQLGTGAQLPPLLLDDDEAVAVAVGMRQAAAGAVTGLEESSLRALTKLRAVLPPRLRQRVDALREMTVPGPFEGPRVAPDILMTLAAACRDDERVTFAYEAADGAASQRRVEPHRLVPQLRRWYLVAYDLDRSDWRTFRLDRITAARGTGKHFRQRDLPASDAAAFVQRAWAPPTTYAVELVLQAPAAFVAERVGRWATVQDEPGGGSRVRATADSLDWAVLLLAAADAPFEVVAPPELGERLAEIGARFVAAGRAARGSR